MRWIRLISGLFLIVGSWQMRDVWLGLAAGILLFQAITNTGCCATGACSMPSSREQSTRKQAEPMPESIE